jgi:hypothetical protein
MNVLKGVREFDQQKNRASVDNSFLSQKSKAPMTFVEKLRFKIAYKIFFIIWKLRMMRSFVYLSLFYPRIVKIQFDARRNGGLAKSMQWIRLAEIIRLVKDFAPERICELGSGTSSAMFSTLCPGKTDVYEEDAYWLDRTRQHIGDLSKNINLFEAKRVVQEKDGELVCFYDMDHSRQYDFMYVDGPTTEVPPEFKGRPVKDPVGYIPDIDVELFWEKGVFPKVIAIDTRRATVRRLLEKSKGKYKIYLKSDLYWNFGQESHGKYIFHTVLVRI